MNFNELRKTLSHLDPSRLQESLWHQHPNGLGWVENTAHVTRTAHVGPNAQVYEKAWVHENARVYEKARVYGNAWVYGKAYVSGNAQVFGSIRVYEEARIYGNAQVYENAWVHGNARVYGDARVYGNTCVHKNAQVCKNARAYENAWIHSKLTRDFVKDKIQGIYSTLGVYPDPNGFYLLYKRVNSTIDPSKFASEFDANFIYQLGYRAEAEDLNPDLLQGCGAGLHVSYPGYWISGNTLLQVAVHINDIISWMDGKVRCRALMPVRIINE